MDRNLNAGPFHAAASVGIAEAAHDGVVEGLASPTGVLHSPRTQTLAAENAISRAYRDVRAGAFMHPLGANRAYEFIGRGALGAEIEAPRSRPCDPAS